MVTKMKMFGFFNQNQVNNKVNNKVNNQVVAPATASASASNQFNLASIMKMQSTGCKSCRGWTKI